MGSLGISAAIELATEMFTEEYLRCEYADNNVNDLILEEECRKRCTSIEELDDSRSPSENEELDRAIDNLPGYDPYENIMTMIQSSEKTMTLDKVMGVEGDITDDIVVEELTSALAESMKGA